MLFLIAFAELPGHLFMCFSKKCNQKILVYHSYPKNFLFFDKPALSEKALLTAW